VLVVTISNEPAGFSGVEEHVRNRRSNPVPALKEARTLSDEALAALCRAGSREAFDEIVRRYRDRVYAVIYRYVGNREDALDVAQETFVRAYRNIGQFAGESKFSTWLHAIAANLARNRLRDRSRKGRNMGTSLESLAENAPAMAQSAAASGLTPRHNAEAGELEAALQDCLDRLSEEARFVFVLRTFEELPYAEIAEAADCRPGTVKSRLNTARRSLHDCLQGKAVL
jgi:RNA polymerase sigma-70 factor, ECF subfamily